MAEQSTKDKVENGKRPKWQDNVEKVATLYFAFCRRTAVTITRAKQRRALKARHQKNRNK